MTETAYTITSELANLEKQLTYLHETWATAESENPDGALYDDDFARDWADAITELESAERVLRWALAGQGGYLFPSNYAAELCTGHGYPSGVTA